MSTKRIILCPVTKAPVKRASGRGPWLRGGAAARAAHHIIDLKLDSANCAKIKM